MCRTLTVIWKGFGKNLQVVTIHHGSRCLIVHRRSTVFTMFEHYIMLGESSHVKESSPFHLYFL